MWASILGIIEGLFKSIPLIAGLFKKATSDRVDDAQDDVDEMEDRARRRGKK